MPGAKVALLLGSKSDLPQVKDVIDTCREFGVECTVRVLSAHRTPDAVREFVSGAPAAGYRVIICAAGGAAHLAGVVASHTTLPVLGLPVAGGALQGLDALLATVQMPGGVPVACFALGGGGPRNAALFAVQVLALGDGELAAKLKTFRAQQTVKVLAADAELQRELRG